MVHLQHVYPRSGCWEIVKVFAATSTFVLGILTPEDGPFQCKDKGKRTLEIHWKKTLRQSVYTEGISASPTFVLHQNLRHMIVVTNLKFNFPRFPSQVGSLSKIHSSALHSLLCGYSIHWLIQFNK